MMCEMFARTGGSCRAMGGSMHLTDFDSGMLGAVAIVGAGIPIAAGAALSAKVRRSGQVSVAFFGDGAINEGVFHETLNMAGLWKLPAIFVCENNHYALSMTNQRSSAVPEAFKRTAGYAIPSERVDGNDVVAVLQAARAAVKRARGGEGATLIECETYRIRGHARFEPGNYRDGSEVEEWKLRDPLERLRLSMIDAGMATGEELDGVRNAVSDALDEAIEYAKSDEEPEPTDYRAYIFKDPIA
jgi:pyruvate dehydrogenase E1 component alpha subunit